MLPDVSMPVLVLLCPDLGDRNTRSICCDSPVALRFALFRAAQHGIVCVTPLQSSGIAQRGGWNVPGCP
ncbi:hypothetical protein OFB92_36510, partial [Escherichia coli]|nr:hypothetical protein [Escherichia coli]